MHCSYYIGAVPAGNNYVHAFPLPIRSHTTSAQANPTRTAFLLSIKLGNRAPYEQQLEAARGAMGHGGAGSEVLGHAKSDGF